MPGAPPRQGHSGSEPYKSLGFNVGEEGMFSLHFLVHETRSYDLYDTDSGSFCTAMMSIEDTLDAVRFEWAAERSVRLKIRGVTLTFST